MYANVPDGPSVVTVAIGVTAPLESTAVRVTGTPVIVTLWNKPLIGCCICKYSIHVAIEASETHGVPGCAGDWSRMVPVNIMPVPNGVVVNGALSVVEL